MRLQTSLMFPLLTSLFMAGCASETDDGEDPAAADDGKADHFNPTNKGSINVELPGTQQVALSIEQPLVYVSFKLFGPSTMKFETKYRATSVAAVNASNKKLDTVLYVYQPEAARWGSYLATNDDGGAGKFSKLTVDLDAGSYRLLIKRKNGSGTSITDLRYSCSGAGCTPLAQSCGSLDLTCIIGSAVDPLSGADLRLAKEVTLSSLPARVKAEAQRASAEIRARDFQTDYTADVRGIYAIYRSEADHTIVAYVVYGTGSGEPDYSDGIVIGIDLAGTRVFEAEDNT